MPSSLAKRLGWLRDPIGGGGFLLWMASFQLSVWLRTNGFLEFADLAAGYVFGFGTAFSGWVAAHLWNGHWSKFIDGHPLWKCVSIFVLSMVFVFGLIGALIDLFGNTSEFFNVGFWVGASIMGACFGPLVNEIDGL